MNYVKAGISNFKGSSTGLILVLFILLVVVIGAFYPTRACAVPAPAPAPGPGPVPVPLPFPIPPIDTDIGSTQNFIINNYTENMMRFVSVTGDASNPFPMNIEPGGSTRYELTTSSYNTTAATASYWAMGSNGNRMASLQFTMRNANELNGVDYRNITTNGPIRVTTDRHIMNIYPTSVIVCGGSWCC
ncbi:hypothetical protein SAMN05444162_0756 [Paenibacillaceae bacterium GAS479]|nr:hypothetical protein SAMN05444162_0756 [Paenibacillaceae bacterium GAS479]